MAVIPDATLRERPTPQPSLGVVGYEPPRGAGAAGQALAGAGQALEGAAQILAHTNERQDTMASINAANRYRAAVLEIERDPKNGFVNARGSAVVGPEFLTTYEGRVNSVRSQIADSLTSPGQKRKFEQHAEVVGLQFKSALLQHQAKQTLLFNETVRNDQITLGLNDIAAHPYDDATYDTQAILMGRSVVDAGREMGLTDKALADFVRVGTSKLQSKALTYRTSGMLIDNPMKASEFFHAHEMEFDPNDRMHLAGALKTAVDAQTSRVNGEAAFKSAIGGVPAAPLPANFNADRVAPFNAKYIENLAALVGKPSKYDALFQKWGQAYNVSPTELKLRAAVESSLNADTVNSSQGAIGLMQFMPDTAAALKIDPKDPEQAIIGAALLMSRAGGTVGGDMGKVDRVYYGGNAEAKGPNTDQYVENMRALRQRLMGAPQPALTQSFLEGREGAVVENARAAAQQQRPGDSVYQDHVVAEARKNLSSQLAALRGQNEQTVSEIMSRFATNTPPRALSDLPVELQTKYGQLPGNVQVAIHSRMAAGDKKLDASSAALYYELLGQAGSDPERFAGVDLLKHFGALPDHQWQQLTMMQKSINAKDAAEQAKGLNFTQMRSTVDDMLKPIKLGTRAKTGSREAQLTEQFYGRLQEAMTTFKAQNDKWPKPEEIKKMGASLLVQGAQAGTGWFFEDKVRAFESPDQAKFYVPLPGAKTPEYASLVAGFEKAMKRPPTVNELQRYYTQYKMAGGK